MKNTRQNSASIKKKVTNVLVHLFLSILSVIWIFRVMPFILTLIIWMGIVCLHGMMQSTENLGI